MPCLAFDHLISVPPEASSALAEVPFATVNALFAKAGAPFAKADDAFAKADAPFTLADEASAEAKMKLSGAKPSKKPGFGRF